MPTIPLIVTDCSNKAKIFNNYFVLQCTPLDETDEVPPVKVAT